MPPSDALLRHRDRTSRISAATLAVSRREWMTLGAGDWDVAWRTTGPRLVSLLVAGQIALGRESVQYVAESVEELGAPAPAVATVSPHGLAGTASDGRPLPSLLESALVGTRMLATKELSSVEALQLGREILDRIVTTQLADASRVAESVAVATRPKIQYKVRVVHAPCCPRCAILAGVVSRWNAGFQRHPGCDCATQVSLDAEGPDEDTDFRDLFDRGQVRGLSQADAQAIRDGADPAQVINAHRGMSTAGGLKTTTEGTTRRGVAGRRLGKGAVRLRPEAIYEIAGDDRDLALRMLKQHAYIF